MTENILIVLPGERGHEHVVDVTEGLGSLKMLVDFTAPPVWREGGKWKRLASRGEDYV